jgi:rare lipoprotein A
VATVTRKQKPRSQSTSRSLAASHGVASFYKHGSRTASGEKFNPGELTAAHRTLPFGTKVRVTDVATGKSVTVRVNDRGPFIDGRVIDVSHAAAESLGMTGKGVAKVKLDVVQ